MTIMSVNFREIKIKTKPINDIKHQDAKAQAFLSFVDEHGRTFTISGFTVRTSKYPTGGYYVTPPSNKRFQFFLAERSLWKEIEKEIIKEFEKANIPIIEEGLTND